MAGFIDKETRLPHASYDLWEERFMTSTYTSAVVYQALLVAADFADEFDYPDDAVHWRNIAADMLDNGRVFFDNNSKLLRKGFLLKEDGSLEFDNRLDLSSLYGAMMFYPPSIGSNEVKQTMDAIEERLLDKVPAGGAPRYEHDTYFRVEGYDGNPWHITTLWAAQYYIRTNQLDRARRYIDWSIGHTLPSGMLSEQINPITGEVLSVTPLVWSHAELINTILDFNKVKP
jgi:GH15 family glucan-1,4-alpha-glucosidase